MHTHERAERATSIERNLTSYFGQVFGNKLDSFVIDATKRVPLKKPYLEMRRRQSFLLSYPGLYSKLFIRMYGLNKLECYITLGFKACRGQTL